MKELSALVWISTKECVRSRSYLDGAGHAGAGRAVLTPLLRVCVFVCVVTRFCRARFRADEIVLKLEVKSARSRKSFLLVLDAQLEETGYLGEQR